MDEKSAEAVLAALPWRCFHCDFVTTDPAEAQAHFGDRDDAEEFKPICKWWARMDDAERRDALQETLKQLHERDDEVMRLQTKVEGLEYQVDSVESCIKSYKPFRNCRTIHDVFCLFDSMEGRAIAAEERDSQESHS